MLGRKEGREGERRGTNGRERIRQHMHAGSVNRRRWTTTLAQNTQHRTIWLTNKMMHAIDCRMHHAQHNRSSPASTSP